MDDDFSSEEGNDPETDYIIDPISQEDNSIAYGLYKKMNLYQYHYNFVKLKYKRLALGWLFAFFFGISYIFLGKEKSLPFNELIAITSLGFFASIGIFLLCFFDVNIYHRLGESIYAACTKFEVENPLLGKSHKNMAKILVKGKISPVLFDGIFYCALTFVLLLISNVTLFLHMVNINKPLAISLFILILFLTLLLNLLILWFSSKLVSTAKKELERKK